MSRKCYSVRLASLVPISDKAYRATSYDGSEDIIPKSQVVGFDYEVEKSDAYWITEWILEKKSLQFSRKKAAWFDDHGNRVPQTEVSHHCPERKNLVTNDIKDLKR